MVGCAGENSGSHAPGTHRVPHCFGALVGFLAHDSFLDAGVFDVTRRG